MKLITFIISYGISLIFFYIAFPQYDPLTLAIFCLINAGICTQFAFDK